MSPEDHFVRDATRGLRGKARQDAQTELRSHLHERAQQLMQQGTPEAGARAQAIGELGSARVIAHGLVRQHGVHPGVMGAALGTLGLMTVVTGLATLYNTSSDGQLSALEQLFSRPTGWVNPCEGRARCIPISSQDEPTDAAYAFYGLIPAGQTAEVFTGTDVRVTGLFRKSVTLPGVASLSIGDFQSDVGWDGHAGLQHGYLNLPALLIGAAQKGWPVRIEGVGSSLQASVQQKTFKPDKSRLAYATMAEYLRQQMNRHLIGTVRQTASASGIAAGSPSIEPFALSVPTPFQPNGSLTVTVPDRNGTYAVVRSDAPWAEGNSSSAGSLTAFQTPADDHSRIRVPVWQSPHSAQTTYQLVASQAHFLAQVEAGKNVAMLVEVPRDLTLGRGFTVVPVQERSVHVQ